MFTRAKLLPYVVIAAVITALVVPGIARASTLSSASGRGAQSAGHGYVASSVTDRGSGVGQYIETRPTSSGGKAVGTEKKHVTLSKKARKVLKSMKGSDRKIFEQMLESADSGATMGKVKPGDVSGSESNSSFVGSLGAALDFSGAGSTTRLALLLAAVVAISAGVGVVAARKQRS
jgi:hypothetical protein